MIKFVITDPLYYEQELIKTYEALTDRTLQPADPERLIINLIAYAMTVIAINIDESARQNLLAYAEGEKLDALAEFYGIKRLQARPAQTILRFSIDTPLNFDVIIPKGTRATPDGNLMFATIEEAKIPAGQLFIDVQAECETPGLIGNGYQIGQIKQLVDPIPYLTSVSNITMSMYGADVEDDERFRERIRLSIERFTNAGSRQAYEFWTKTAHQDIEDVSVYSSSPGVVNVVFILKDGALPDTTIIELVRNFLSDEKIRPLTDKVIVSSPEVIEYDISFTYYINRNDEAKVKFIQNEVEKAVKDFVLWTKIKIGRDILPEELIRRVKEAGAYRIDLSSPTYQKLEINQVAHARNIIITYGGLIED
jgi:phage-related baseplate assembly protein